MSRLLYYCCVFGALLYTTECKQYRYDYSYDCEVNGWFKLHRIPATWHDAWLRCQLEGAVLASPENIYMNLAIRNVMKNKQAPWSGVHTGIHATFSKGDFFSVEGVPLSRMQVDWMPAEPDNKDNDEDCILMAANGTIADINCNQVHPYICFRKKTKNMVLNGCGTFDQEYNLDPRTGSCYKFHRVPRNWTRAYMTCAAEGGHLAVVNSETEANVLRELFEKTPANSIISAIPGIMRDIMHVGFHDWSERGVWTTIHGMSLIETGFNLWAEGQPDNAPPGEYCGGMFRNGRLDDVWCHERGTFVCEKTPHSLMQEEDL
ncbi:C-type mannose receptor 2-like [Maniola hyperantus]|uniref:C-type mannose receptor 2-like n=1 Tax=Aphantopus hyperantus TaxID=2795564 RepID=UPI00156833ED|nr:C-type mannose receptor 2-like [Maniola hyperantus]